MSSLFIQCIFLMILHHSSLIAIIWYLSNIKQTRCFFWISFCRYVWNSSDIASSEVIRTREMMKTISWLQINVCIFTNQHCVCRSSYRAMKKIITTIIWFCKRRAEIMIRRFFLLSAINIIRMFYQFLSMMIIMILWSLLIHLVFVLKIICRSVWIWLFNTFYFIIIMKLD